ncbi:MAG: hypothetical protein U1E83_04680 [Methylotetracoccus sp.]
MTVHQRFAVLLACAAAITTPVAWAYGGGGGGGSSCAEPKFFSPAPADGSTVASLDRFTFVASDSEADSLAVEIDGQKVPANIAPMRNGDLDVTVTPSTPITKPGRLRISITAKSKDGCSGFKPYYIDIKP